MTLKTRRAKGGGSIVSLKSFGHGGVRHDAQDIWKASSLVGFAMRVN